MESEGALFESGGALMESRAVPVWPEEALIKKASSASEALMVLSGSSGSCLAPSPDCRFAHFMEAWVIPQQS